MNDVLVLIGGETPSDPVAWARIDAAGEIAARGQAHDAGALDGRGARVVLIVPGADAQLKRLDLPARTEAQARAGAAVLFEGALATSAEGMHYAVGAAQDDRGARLVAAIDAGRMTQWLARCRGLGVEPHIAALDCTAWPVPAGEVGVVETADRAIVAAGPLGGYTLEPELAPSLFARWLAKHQAAIHAVRVSGGPARRWSEGLGLGAPPVLAAEEVDAFETLARGAAALPDTAPNLRQGPFALAAQKASSWRIWRLAAALLVVAVLLQVGALLVSGLRDRAAAQDVRAVAEQEFRAARPEVRRIVNLRAQVRALSNAMTQAENHPVLAVNDPVIAVLQSHPLVRLDEVRHQAPGKGVRMVWSAPQAQPIEAAMQALRNQSLKVEARDTRTIEGRVVADFVVAPQ